MSRYPAYGRKDAVVIAVANWFLRTFLSMAALSTLDRIYRAGIATGRPIPSSPDETGQSSSTVLK